MVQEPEVKGAEYEDDPDIRHQPCPEPVSEECDIDADDKYAVAEGRAWASRLLGLSLERRNVATILDELEAVIS